MIERSEPGAHDEVRPRREGLHHDLGPADRAPLRRRRTRRASTTPAISATRASSPSPAASTRRCTAARPGPCASSRASAPRTQTNERFKYLLEHGSHGLSVAFDLPTLMGRDPDHPLSLGEVGKCGVAVTSLQDMETLFEGIPLDEVSTSMTINSPAAMLLAFYVLVGEKQGVSTERAHGHGPGRHPEGVHRPEGVHLPAPAEHARDRGHGPLLHRAAAQVELDLDLRATTSARRAPRPPRSWPSPCATASSTCSGAWTPGMDVDSFAPRLSFFFNSHSDFFEEIAKFRAARRIWARTMKDRFKAKNPRSWMLPLPHPDRGGEPHRPAALQQRGAHRAAGPGRGAGRHPVAAHELPGRGPGPAHRGGGHDRAAHPAGDRPRVGGGEHRRSPRGSYFVEKLTNDIEAEALDYFRKIDAMGGMVRGSRARLPAARDPGGGLPVPEGGRAQGEGDRGRERARDGGEAPPDPLHRRDGGGRADRAGGAPCVPRATMLGWRALHDLEGRCARNGQHHDARSSRPRVPTPRSARCATRCARSGASTKSRRSSDWKQ